MTLITKNHSSLDNNATTLVQSASVHLRVSPKDRLEPERNGLVQSGVDHTRANCVDNDLNWGCVTRQMLDKSMDHEFAILVPSEAAENGPFVIIVHDALASGDGDLFKTVLDMRIGAHESDAAGGVTRLGCLAEQGHQGEDNEEVGVAVDWFVFRVRFPG
jgi:hypothetical protein